MVIIVLMLIYLTRSDYACVFLALFLVMVKGQETKIRLVSNEKIKSINP